MMPSGAKLNLARKSDQAQPVGCAHWSPKRAPKRSVSAVTQNHPPGVESKDFKITHPEKVKGLANRLWSGADFGHVKLSQDGLGQRNSGTQKQGLVEAAHRPGAPDRPADGAKIPSRRLKFTPIIDPRHRAG